MATARTKIGRTRVIQEQTAFGGDVSSSVGSMGDLRLTDGVFPNVDTEMLADGRLVQNVHEHPVDVPGFKKGDGLTLKGYLCSSGQTLNAAATPTKTTMLKMLERIVGGYQVAAGSAYASAASATGVTVTAAQGSRFPIGTLVGIESASGSGLFCVRKIATQATDALMWSIATGLGNTAFTMATGCRLLNSFMIYPTNNPNTAGLHLAFLTESEDRFQNWWFTGANASAFGIEWPLGKDLMWSATMMAARRWLDTEVGTPLGTGGSIGTSSYDDGTRCIATAGNVWFTPFAGTALSAPQVFDFSINLGTKWQSDDAFNGTEGRTGYSYLPDQATVNLVVASDSTFGTIRTYENARDAGTLYQLMAQAGQTAGNIVAFEAPRLQIVSAKPVDKGGLRRVALTLKCLQDTIGTGDLPQAPWRMGWL
jgi:hypothetical protein